MTTRTAEVGGYADALDLTEPTTAECIAIMSTRCDDSQELAQYRKILTWPGYETLTNRFLIHATDGALLGFARVIADGDIVPAEDEA